MTQGNGSRSVSSYIGFVRSNVANVLSKTQSRLRQGRGKGGKECLNMVAKKENKVAPDVQEVPTPERTRGKARITPYYGDHKEHEATEVSQLLVDMLGGNSVDEVSVGAGDSIVNKHFKGNHSIT
jgi:hypothetical protein